MKITKETERHIRRLARNLYGYKQQCRDGWEFPKNISKEDIKLELGMIMSVIYYFLAGLGIDYRDYAEENWKETTLP